MSHSWTKINCDSGRKALFSFDSIKGNWIKGICMTFWNNVPHLVKVTDAIYNFLKYAWMRVLPYYLHGPFTSVPLRIGLKLLCGNSI